MAQKRKFSKATLVKLQATAAKAREGKAKKKAEVTEARELREQQMRHLFLNIQTHTDAMTEELFRTTPDIQALRSEYRMVIMAIRYLREVA